jgi:hypothetical protein
VRKVTAASRGEASAPATAPMLEVLADVAVEYRATAGLPIS